MLGDLRFDFIFAFLRPVAALRPILLSLLLCPLGSLWCSYRLGCTANAQFLGFVCVANIAKLGLKLALGHHRLDGSRNTGGGMVTPQYGRNARYRSDMRGCRHLRVGRLIRTEMLTPMFVARKSILLFPPPPAGLRAKRR